MTRVVALAGTALVVSTALASAAPPAKSIATGAQATIVRVSIPGHEAVSLGDVSWPTTEGAEVQSFSYPDDGSVVKVGISNATVSAQPGGTASARASVDTIAVSLLGGDVVADQVSAAASAGATTHSAGADISTSTVQGLQVLGQSERAKARTSVPLGDWGTLEVLFGSVEKGKGGRRRAEGQVVALDVRLTAAHAGLPPGSEIVVGSASAAAKAEATAPPPPGITRGSTPSVSSANVGAGVKHPAPPEPEGTTTIPGGPVRAPPKVTVHPSLDGYVFPVFGPSSFGDSFGAPRPDLPSGWHHGEDIFAPIGAPVLAVADGPVYSIGWNRIGGYRLWLRDHAGNQFYYAHLSAYSPLAVEGAEVSAGDVIGFVGDTGDADGGAPHLHFEIHPAAMVSLGYDGVIAPYPYLVAWRHAQDVSFAAGRVYVPAGPGKPHLPAPGAILLQADDIASTSGLVPGALEKALAARATATP